MQKKSHFESASRLIRDLYYKVKRFLLYILDSIFLAKEDVNRVIERSRDLLASRTGWMLILFFVVLFIQTSRFMIDDPIIFWSWQTGRVTIDKALVVTLDYPEFTAEGAESNIGVYVNNSSQIELQKVKLIFGDQKSFCVSLMAIR